MRLRESEKRQDREGDNPSPGETVNTILDSDQECDRHQDRAEHIGPRGYLRTSQRVIGGGEQYLQRHHRHCQREDRDKGRHFVPFRTEQGFDQRIGGNCHAEIERAGDQHDQPDRLEEGPCQGAGVGLQPGISREGDFVQGRHKFCGEDRRQEQRFCIEAKIMRIEVTAGDEYVGLALDRPEQVAGQQGGAKSEHRSGACEIEGRQYIEFDRYDEADRPAPEYRQRCIDQCPDAITIIGAI